MSLIRKSEKSVSSSTLFPSQKKDSIFWPAKLSNYLIGKLPCARIMNLEDNFRHQGLRRNLVMELEKKGIRDQAVLNAIGKIPRHFFFETALVNHAYQDKPFPIGEGQTISQPFTVARQSELLQVKRGDKILEIGTGSGYQCCVLLELGAQVYTIEYQPNLFKKAKSILPGMGYRPNFFLGDGSRGLPTFAPYDAILVTAGAPGIPAPLIDQLKPGGRLVIPTGNNEKQEMVRIFKNINGEIFEEKFGLFSFVPLKGSFGWS
jgi:protein-L-isoaspartate(D-aspartate) O-methyltransferase